ncbi:MAG: hypothetical protein GY904_19585 [Planctomycetaceae bacterium]|nr:hypothetical protein [Planctomycetaceae bacterium]
MAKRKRAKTPQASGVTIPTKCRECGSTKRSRYTNSIVLGSGILLRDDLPGIPAGTPYESLTKSRCICLKCGQARVDQRFEFDPEVLYALRTNKQEGTTEQA